MKFLGVIETEDTRNFIKKVAEQLGLADPTIIVGSPVDAANYIEKAGTSPTYILIELSARSNDVLPEIDKLAEHCDSNTKVIIIGEINDLNFYRQLLSRGVIEYFIKPVGVNDIKDAFFKNTLEHSKKADSQGKVISVMSAASGDGATTIALNTGYVLATELKQKTVIVDMDYQFGMLARNLDLSASYGLKELYEHPEGSIDLTLLEKTLVPFKNNLHIIAAPKALKFMPEITPNMIANLIFILRQRFDYVLLDLPHTWSEWLASVIKEADHNLLVAQLWLKSATHSARLLDALQGMRVSPNKTSIVINRSGSKFKEAITPADFALACKKKVNYYISNDSKTITVAENQGKTAIEAGSSILNRQFMEIAKGMTSLNTNKSLDEE